VKGETARPWTLRLICCGRDAGTESFATWDEADAFRESYCTGPGVLDPGHPQRGGHDRAAVLIGASHRPGGTDLSAVQEGAKKS
jgi:hypothetical protein